MVRNVIQKKLTFRESFPQAKAILATHNVDLFLVYQDLFAGFATHEHWLRRCTKGQIFYSNYIINEKLVQNLEKVHDSYRKLPINCVQPLCGKRTPMARTVLNDYYVSKATLSHECESNFPSQSHSQPEETLFHLEDTRFELDIMINRLDSLIQTLKHMTERSVNNNKTNDAYNVGQEHKLDTVQTRLLQQIYGNKGETLVGLLHQFPKKTVDIIMPRLKKKWFEWREVRDELQDRWKRITEENIAGVIKCKRSKLFYDEKQLWQDLKKEDLWEELVSSDVATHEKSKFEEYTQINRTDKPEMDGLIFELKDKIVFKIIQMIFMKQYETMASNDDVAKMETIWKFVLLPFFLQTSRKTSHKQNNQTKHNNSKQSPSEKHQPISSQQTQSNITNNQNVNQKANNNENNSPNDNKKWEKSRKRHVGKKYLLLFKKGKSAQENKTEIMKIQIPKKKGRNIKTTTHRTPKLIKTKQKRPKSVRIIPIPIANLQIIIITERKKGVVIM
eukprot:UN24750